MVNLTINGRPCEAEEESTVLEAARQMGVEIPTLCYHPAVPPYASCRLCMVEATLRGRTRVVASCAYPVAEGLVVETETPRIQRLRRVLLEFYLAQAPAAEVVRELAARYGVTETRFTVRDPEEKCILCGLCERVCGEAVGRSGISFAHRGVARKVTPPFGEPPRNCSGCGACVFVCPTGCVTERMEEGSIRIAPWEAQVPVARCRVCGEPVGSQVALEELAEKLGIEPERLLVCSACRRKRQVKELARTGRRGLTSPAPLP